MSHQRLGSLEWDTMAAAGRPTQKPLSDTAGLALIKGVVDKRKTLRLEPAVYLVS